MAEEITETDRLVAQIAAAYLGRNEVAAERIPEIMATIRAALLLQAPPALDGSPPNRSAPAQDAPDAAPVNTGATSPTTDPMSSIQEDHIACLICGKEQGATLKRHLRAAHGMHEYEYKRAYGLPEDVALTSKSYSERRRSIARKMHSDEPKK